jgi:hypothetical protein
MLELVTLRTERAFQFVDLTAAILVLGRAPEQARPTPAGSR